MNLHRKKNYQLKLAQINFGFLDLKIGKWGCLFFFGFFFFFLPVITVEKYERKGDECACHGNADEYLEVTTYIHVRFLV
jgi:hypothetical protein